MAMVRVVDDVSLSSGFGCWCAASLNPVNLGLWQVEQETPSGRRPFIRVAAVLRCQRLTREMDSNIRI